MRKPLNNVASRIRAELLNFTHIQNRSRILLYINRGGRTFTIQFKKVQRNSNTYEIQPFQYTFFSKTSVLDYGTEEQRRTRNYSLLVRTLKMVSLKCPTLWGSTVNKSSYLHINLKNTKLSSERETKAHSDLNSLR